MIKILSYQSISILKDGFRLLFFVLWLGLVLALDSRKDLKGFVQGLDSNSLCIIYIHKFLMIMNI